MKRPRVFSAGVCLLAFTVLVMLDRVGWPAYALAGAGVVLMLRGLTDF